MIIKNVERISSYEIAELMDVTPSQVRQDFALYGTFGMQGYGFHVRTMRDELLRILGVDRGYRVILLGRSLRNSDHRKLRLYFQGVHIPGGF